MTPCPICGGPLVGTGLRWIPAARIVAWDIGAAKLSKSEAVVFGVLWRLRQTGELVSSRILAHALYTGADGGPLSALKNPALFVLNMRIKLRGSPLAIESGAGSDGGYRIVRR